MIVWASGLGIGICRFSRRLRGVGVIAMPNARLDTMWHFEVPPPAAVLQLLLTCVVVGVVIDRCCVACAVEVTR
jgi:hypothetical protein